MYCPKAARPSQNRFEPFSCKRALVPDCVPVVSGCLHAPATSRVLCCSVRRRFCRSEQISMCLCVSFTISASSGCLALSSVPVLFSPFLAFNLERAPIHRTIGQYLSCRFSQSHLRNTNINIWHILTKQNCFAVTSQGSEKSMCVTLL